MGFDFSFALLGATGLAGVIWLGHVLYRRAHPAAPAGPDQATEPVIVDWARSLFPVLLLVLVLRSFVAEPYRIPSGSMMPTLDVGDFILVNKFAYGLRVPGFNWRMIDTGHPQRGDIVVFRFPGYPCNEAGRIVRTGDLTCANPSAKIEFENVIKRVIGRPGDTIETRGDHLFINGIEVPEVFAHDYQGNPRLDEDRQLLEGHAAVYTEQLPGGNGGTLEHAVAMTRDTPRAPYEIPSPTIPATVPAGCYIVMGDNRTNSLDSRWWGCLPEDHLVGKAFLIWFSWKGFGTGGVGFERMGRVIR